MSSINTTVPTNTTVPKNTTVPTNTICQILPFKDNEVFTSNSINRINNNSNCILNGTYNVSSSSYLNDNTMPYNVFNKTLSNTDTVFWSCNTIENNFDFNPLKVTPYIQSPYDVKTGKYQGGGNSNFFKTTVINGSNNGSNNDIINNDIIEGEWIQIQLPEIICLVKYSILVPVSQHTFNYFPLEFYLVGSYDGKNWYYIDHQILNNVNTDNGIPKPFLINNIIVKYNYFRLIIVKMPLSCSIVRINQFCIYSNPSCLISTDLINKEGFVGYMNDLNNLNKQYSYHNIYPSINNYSNFSDLGQSIVLTNPKILEENILIEQPMIIEENILIEQPIIIEKNILIEQPSEIVDFYYNKNIIKNEFYENLCVTILLISLFGSITILLLKNNK